MKVLDLIDKYYPQDNELKHILNVHSRSVADKALWIAGKHPELNLDTVFLEEAAMLHDIGIFLTHAPGIQWFGTEPFTERYYGSKTSCPPSRNVAGEYGRTSDLLCRQVFFENPSRP